MMSLSYLKPTDHVADKVIEGFWLLVVGKITGENKRKVWFKNLVLALRNWIS